MDSKLTIPQDQLDKLRDIRLRRLEELKARAKDVKLMPLPKGQAYKAVAISVDASNVPVETDVVDSVIIRCADSDGTVYFQGVVATDAPRVEIEGFMNDLFNQTPVLKNLLKNAQATSWQDLAAFHVASGASDLDRFVREMLEWGSLVTLAERSHRTILLKDGLLRGMAIRPRGGFLENLRTFFGKNCNDRGNFLIGIAKETAVLEKYKVLLRFVEGFSENRAFYLKIPHDLLEETYGWRFLATDVKWGDLYFVRPQPHSSARVMTIEVPEFLDSKLDDVLKILAAFPSRSLPDRFRGLPDPVARAHENTNLLVNLGKALQKEVMR